MSDTPIPNRLNYISCRRLKDGRLISLAEDRTMTFLELKEKLNTMSDDQLDQPMEVIVGKDETMLIELAVGTSTDQLIFIQEFDYD